MTDEERAALEATITKEREELARVPVESVYVGPIRRCHFCGQPYAPELLKSVDGHVKGDQSRLACPGCAP